MLSRGYRVIRVLSEEGNTSVISDQQILLSVARANPEEPFTFFVKLDQGLGELDFPTFVRTFQELMEAA